jgi:hypothetical protein
MSMLPGVVQIVPCLPPLIDGLGDHAIALAAALLEYSGTPSRFLVVDPAWVTAGGPAREPRGIPAPAGVAETFAACLASHADQDVVLLHYVGYAYDARQGRPGWLLAALTRWRRERPGRRLITMFHELYASGPPWRKAFWLSAGQQRVAAGLARLSDASFTSNSHYAAWLAKHLPDGRPCPVWPVLSNVGEPTALLPYDQRPAALAVFGRAPNRARAYERGGDALVALCQRLGLREVHDLGAPLPGGPPRLPGLTVTAHGILPPAGVSGVLAQCRVGYLDNATGRLSKSGVFAAYASHGLAPLVECQYPDEDGLVGDRHLAALTAAPAAEVFPAIASAAHAWYHGHSSAALAGFVAATMTRVAAAPVMSPPSAPSTPP